MAATALAKAESARPPLRSRVSEGGGDPPDPDDDDEGEGDGAEEEDDDDDASMNGRVGGDEGGSESREPMGAAPATPNRRVAGSRSPSREAPNGRDHTRNDRRERSLDGRRTAPPPPPAPGGGGGGGSGGGDDRRDNEGRRRGGAGGGRGRRAGTPPRPSDPDEPDDPEDDEGSGNEPSRPPPVSLSRLKEQNEVKINWESGKPTASTFLMFSYAVREATTICGQDKDSELVLRWVDVALRPEITMERLAISGHGFATLDYKLAVALQKLADEELKRQIVNEKLKRSREDSTSILTGRQILWLFSRHLRTTLSQTKLYGFSELVTIEWFGDSRIEQFLSYWENRVTQLSSDISDWMLAEVLFRAMRRSKVLEIEVRQFMTLYPNYGGTENGTAKYSYLIGVLRQQVEWDRYENNQKQRRDYDHGERTRLSGGKGVKHMAVPFTQPQFGHAKPLHPQNHQKGGKVGSKSNNGKGGSKSGGVNGKSKGKGTGKRERSVSAHPRSNSVKPPGGERRLCVYFVGGFCSKGDACSFTHDRPKNPQEESFYKEMIQKRGISRSKSPAPKGDGMGICRFWKAKRECRYGEACRFSHAVPAAPAGPARGNTPAPAARPQSPKPDSKVARPTRGRSPAPGKS